MRLLLWSCHNLIGSADNGQEWILEPLPALLNVYFSVEENGHDHPQEPCLIVLGFFVLGFLLALRISHSRSLVWSMRWKQFITHLPNDSKISSYPGLLKDGCAQVCMWAFWLRHILFLTETFIAVSNLKFVSGSFSGLVFKVPVNNSWNHMVIY